MTTIAAAIEQIDALSTTNASLTSTVNTLITELDSKIDERVLEPVLGVASSFVRLSTTIVRRRSA